MKKIYVQGVAGTGLSVCSMCRQELVCLCSMCRQELVCLSVDSLTCLSVMFFFFKFYFMLFYFIWLSCNSPFFDHLVSYCCITSADFEISDFQIIIQCYMIENQTHRHTRIKHMSTHYNLMFFKCLFEEKKNFKFTFAILLFSEVIY